MPNLALRQSCWLLELLDQWRDICCYLLKFNDCATLKLKTMELLVSSEAFFQRTLSPSLGSIARTFPVPMSSASLLPEVQGC